MIQILALSHQGAPVHGISARFGEDGGTIGRANANELVLDGPDRTVSRIHARIVHRDGVWVIVDHGSNPTQLNGQLIGAGNEAVLSDGDRLQLGSYELLVSQAGHEADGREPGAGPDPWASSSA